MSTIITLYKPVNTKFIPGQIYTKSLDEYLNECVFNDDCDSDSIGLGNFEDGISHELFNINALHGCYNRRNNYYNDIREKFFTKYNDMIIDRLSFERDTEYFRNKNIRYAIPVDIMFTRCVKCVPRFYRRINTIRYAFTYKDAVDLIMQNMVKNMTTYDILIRLRDMWEDGMFLELSW